MSTSPEKAKETLFDSLIAELLAADADETAVDICLSGNQRAISSVPLRQRIIALGFVKKLSLDEVNERLTANGCDQLYARSLSEATLIYALKNNYTYEDWKKISKEVMDLKGEICSDGFFSKARVSLNDISCYVMDNSVYRNELAVTMHKTQLLQKDLSDPSIEKDQLKKVLISNINSFCTYREKSRYYFCKYLMYYLISQKDRYLRRLKTASRAEDVLDELTAFKSVTVLRRKKHSYEEADAVLSEAAISWRGIYQAFQDLYFEFTSTDWMEIILEKYGDIDHLDNKRKESLLAYIRSYNTSKASLSDDELLAWQKRELEQKEDLKDRETSYQTNRAGENFLRKVVRGELDLDRTTLMAFLVFFDWNATIPKEHRIDIKRLNDILSECGFSKLDPGRYVDDFFMDYMSAEDPVAFLIGEAEIMAMSEENFYLYKTYLNSKNSETEWEKSLDF